MLAKLTRGNQLTIPKEIVDRIRLQAGRDYLDVECFHGLIVLRPVDVKPRGLSVAYDRLLKDAFTVQPGDIVADERSAGSVLRKRMKKR